MGILQAPSPHKFPSPYLVIPAQAGIQQKYSIRVADKPDVVWLRQLYLISWIPAFAGMMR
jgi:hypothetical protein